MISEFTTLPTLEELNEFVSFTNQQVKRKENEYENEIRYLKMKLELMNFKLFGRKSEKLSADEELQGRLFDEIEFNVEDTSESEKEEPIKVKSHARRKRGRRPIPSHLPRVEVVYDIPEEEKIDRHGTPLQYIGDEICEKIDIKPAEIRILRIIRRKYSLKCADVECEDAGVKTATLPPQIIPQGIATPGLLAYIGASKFCDAIPLYRQEKIFNRFGVDMPRSTMCSWFIHIDKRYDLARLMASDLGRYPVLGIDETGLQVLNEQNRKNTTRSWMCVFRGQGTDRPLVVFKHIPTRSHETMRETFKEMLGDYQGVIQTDGLAVYEYLSRKDSGIIHAGCWAHGRRDFFNAVKSCVNAEFSRTVVDIIRKLYAVEDEAREKKLSYEKISMLRQEKSKPVLTKLRDILVNRHHSIAPKSPTGRAIKYVLDRWKSLCEYLDDGRIPIDNNLVENTIRPFVVGRKNWLFSGSPGGAAASATMYSLIETAKANGMEPYWYLRYLFEKLPEAKTPEERYRLLPHVVDPKIIDRYRRDGVN